MVPRFGMRWKRSIRADVTNDTVRHNKCVGINYSNARYENKTFNLRIEHFNRLQCALKIVSLVSPPDIMLPMSRCVDDEKKFCDSNSHFKTLCANVRVTQPKPLKQFLSNLNNFIRLLKVFVLCVRRLPSISIRPDTTAPTIWKCHFEFVPFTFTVNIRTVVGAKSVKWN